MIVYVCIHEKKEGNRVLIHSCNDIAISILTVWLIASISLFHAIFIRKWGYKSTE